MRKLLNKIFGKKDKKSTEPVSNTACKCACGKEGCKCTEGCDCKNCGCNCNDNCSCKIEAPKKVTKKTPKPVVKPTKKIQVKAKKKGK